MPYEEYSRKVLVLNLRGAASINGQARGPDRHGKYDQGVWLDKPRRNSIFKTLTDLGLDPAEFDLHEAVRPFAAADGWELKHVGSGSTFLISRRGGSSQFATIRKVGDSDAISNHAASWSFVPIALGKWCREVQADLDTPDLWNEFRKGRQELVSGSSSAENTPLTGSDQAEIAVQLKVVRTYLLEHGELSDEQMERVEERLDYLADAAKRLGRLDWRSAALGTVFTMAMEATVPTHVAHHVLLLLLQPLGHLFGHPIPGLPAS